VGWRPCVLVGWRAIPCFAFRLGHRSHDRVRHPPAHDRCDARCRMPLCLSPSATPISMGGCSTPPSARGSATRMDLHPLAPPSPPRPGGAGYRQKCPAHIAVSVTQIALELLATHSRPLRTAACADADSPRQRAALISRPSETQLASPSVPARRSTRFWPPKKHARSSPPSPHLSPHEISPPPRMGDSMGATRNFLLAEAHSPFAWADKPQNSLGLLRITHPAMADF
jgi:hypothetical protein